MKKHPDGNITPSGRRITSQPQIQNLPGTLAYELEMSVIWRTWNMHNSKVVPVEADQHMMACMQLAKGKGGGFAEMFEAAVRAAPELYTKPIYMYQRKGLTSWVVCDHYKLQELKGQPHLFRTRTLQGMATPLKVWEGAMPESNGKTNYTAILYTDDITTGITIYRSEYPDRTRYEADRFRHMIGQRAEAPCISEYDTEKHSGYKGPKQWFTAEDIKKAWLDAANLFQGCMGQAADPDEADAEEYLKSIQE